MAVKKRGKMWHFKIRVFGKQVGVATNARLKQEAEQIEMAVLTACRSGDYRGLNAESREVCIRMFKNQGLELPDALVLNDAPNDQLTLWEAVRTCMQHPEVKASKNSDRLRQCFINLVEYWGKDFLVKSIWIPEIKAYQMARLNQGAAPATINKEKSALSKMFQYLVEGRIFDVNPARQVKNLSEKSGEREVYISFADFCAILKHVPQWFQAIAQTAFYTGMRRGEIVNLRRSSLNLDKRMIYLGPDDVKENRRKRVPVHKDLVPILVNVMKVVPLSHDLVFHNYGKQVNGHNQLRWCWDRKVSKAGLNPCPRFHDLRHTWRTNARRSRVDYQIAEAILGHATRLKSPNTRYGRISDSELLNAIDLMTFDHGTTEILVAQK